MTITSTKPSSSVSIAGSGGVFTKILTADSIIITPNSSVKSVSVKNKSAVAGTITGDFAGSDVLDIDQDEVISISTAFIFTGLTIDAPAGCTLHVIIGF